MRNRDIIWSGGKHKENPSSYSPFIFYSFFQPYSKLILLLIFLKKNIKKTKKKKLQNNLLFSFFLFIQSQFFFYLFYTKIKTIIIFPKTATTNLALLPFFLPASEFLRLTCRYRHLHSQAHCYSRRLTFHHILILLTHFAVTVIFSVFVNPSLYRCTLCFMTHLPIKRLASA